MAAAGNPAHVARFVHFPRVAVCTRKEARMMRLRVLIGAWALAGVGVAAQPPAPGPGPQAAEQPRHVTLTGCVKAWDASTMGPPPARSEEHTSELQSQSNLVCRLLLEK